MKKYKVLDTKKMTEVKGGNCSWRGAGQAAVSGGIGGSLGGAVTVPVVGYVPGWVAGAGLGAAAYGATCWW